MTTPHSVLAAVATVAALTALFLNYSATAAVDTMPAIESTHYIQLETQQARPSDASYTLSNMPELDESASNSRISAGLRLSQEYRCVRRAALVTCFR